MDLLGIVENPIPRGPRAGFFRGADGAMLRYARWRPSVAECRGTICLFSGRGEFIEKYFEVIGELRDRGFAVVTMDWRGQGRSQRMVANQTKGHIKNFKQYDDDLAAFMEQVVLPDCPPPFFALAHSMGANVVLRVVHNYAWFHNCQQKKPGTLKCSGQVGDGDPRRSRDGGGVWTGKTKS